MDGFWQAVLRLSEDGRLPFELRSHLAYLYQRRTWPAGRPVTVNQKIDFYDVDGRVVFGELTNYPAGGNDRWEPASFGTWLGSWWHLD